ncbi:MAG TPA: cation diffusion facilitator family transporter [Jatrophihabitantaceae bacterium]|nr:cation diffusion facilitator family transporter [Jatrophihabitantaceae bacterium]
MSHDHAHAHAVTARTDRRWLLAALVVIVLFMAGEVTAGVLAHSLALITDAGHMVTDAAAIGVAVIAARIARRPAQGAYTYGFTRVDTLSGQLNGMTLLLLATWFAVLGVRRLVNPVQSVHGGVVGVVAIVGVAVNLLATWLAGRANRSSLNVRGVLAHLLTDLWAFLATFAAGIVIVVTGWVRADAVASLVVAALMTWTGWRLVRAAGRVLLEAAPKRVDPFRLGETMAAVDGVAQVHDLHVWQLGSGADAVSAHVLVSPPYDCHEVSARLRTLLTDDYGIGHVTLQADHADAPAHDAGDCAEAHGEIHIADPQ